MNLNKKLRLLSCAFVAVLSSQVFAVTPPMPPMTNGDGNPANNGMKHALVSQNGAALEIHIADPPATPVTMTSGFGVDFDPAKFDVLEEIYFNAQHGWLPDGPFNLPAGGEIWIERTSATQPAGSTFKVYEAGNGMNIPGEGMANWTMNEIYSSDGYKWRWDGVMQHDYFTADRVGDYSMSFDVYIGDANGVRDSSYEAASATFAFAVVPEAPSGVMFVLGAAIALGAARWTTRSAVHA